MLKAIHFVIYVLMSAVYTGPIWGLDKDLVTVIVSGFYLALGILILQDH